MITGNGLLEVEAIEQLPLVPIEPTHHRPISQKAASPRPNHDSAAPSKRLLQQNRPGADSRGAAIADATREHFHYNLRRDSRSGMRANDVAYSQSRHWGRADRPAIAMAAPGADGRQSNCSTPIFILGRQAPQIVHM